MKIAILTLPLHSNYGGVIQNYALQKVLQKNGHETETIDIKKTLFKDKSYLSFLKYFMALGNSKAKQHIRRFIDENISLTQPFYCKKDFLKYDFSRYDAIIVGSDQIWRVAYACPDIYTYYLDFIKNGTDVKKIAFAASFGKDVAEYTEEQIQKCGELIKDFDVVTVREDSAINIINNIYKWDCKNPPVQVLDPTMLLDKSDYINLFSDNCTNEISGGLFYYVLDMTEEKRNIINKISAELGVKPFTVNRKSRRWYDRLEKRMVPPLEEWLQAFNKSSYVFTDSFHGSVFSIIFNKEFIAFGNKRRGISRFNSLLSKFNLDNRLIYTGEEYNSNLYSSKIDWNSVNSILNDERGKIRNYFKKLNIDIF